MYLVAFLGWKSKWKKDWRKWHTHMRSTRDAKVMFIWNTQTRKTRKNTPASNGKKGNGKNAKAHTHRPGGDVQCVSMFEYRVESNSKERCVIENRIKAFRNSSDYTQKTSS